jgi:hypothetical protein
VLFIVALQCVTINQMIVKRKFSGEAGIDVPSRVQVRE